MRLYSSLAMLATIFAASVASFSALAKTKPELILDYIALSASIVADPLYKQVKEEERFLVSVYNFREVPGAKQPDFNRYNRLVYTLQKKYEPQLDRLKHEFALEFPNDVELVFGERNGVPIVIFGSESPLAQALTLDPLEDRDQRHIQGDLIYDYRPFDETAQEFIASWAPVVYSDTVRRISKDPLYWDLAAEEQKQVSLHKSQDAGSSPKRDLGRLNELRKKFKDKYGPTFHLIRHAYALQYPYVVDETSPGKDGVPYVFFKSYSLIGKALNFDVLGLWAQGVDRSSQLSDYIPFIQTAESFAGLPKSSVGARICQNVFGRM